jgi:hypothetical protein
MKKADQLYLLVNAWVLWVFGTASAASRGADPRLLSLVPPGAVIVAEVTYGAELTFLVLTRKNTADLTKLGISISKLLPVIATAALGIGLPLSRWRARAASAGKAIRNLCGIDSPGTHNPLNRRPGRHPQISRPDLAEGVRHAHSPVFENYATIASAPACVRSRTSTGR